MKLFPEEQDIELHIKHPKPFILHRRDKSPIHWALKIKGDYVQENYKTVENPKPALTGLMHRFTQFRKQQKTTNL